MTKPGRHRKTGPGELSKVGALGAAYATSVAEISQSARIGAIREGTETGVVAIVGG